jgi:hypothetical protein
LPFNEDAKVFLKPSLAILFDDYKELCFLNIKKPNKTNTANMIIGNLKLNESK